MRGAPERPEGAGCLTDGLQDRVLLDYPESGGFPPTFEGDGGCGHCGASPVGGLGDADLLLVIRHQEARHDDDRDDGGYEEPGST